MSTTRRIHIANAQARNATVVARSVSPQIPELIMGIGGSAAEFKRYVAAGAGKLHEELCQTISDDYSQALIDGDPEVDFEVVGRFIDSTQSVLLSSSGEPLYAAPKIVEITFAANGAETDRRDPVEVAATVNETVPVRWTGKKMSKQEVVRKFFFKRTMQLGHVDGISFDFLKGMAQELHDENVMVLLGAGEAGKDPLIMQMNGSPYRGFLEGRIQGDSYILLLHLSNMELKKPEPKAAAAEKESGDE
jgi:hypothetical protein